jgi:hypothetical protein
MRCKGLSDASLGFWKTSRERFEQEKGGLKRSDFGLYFWQNNLGFGLAYVKRWVVPRHRHATGLQWKCCSLFGGDTNFALEFRGLSV